MPQLLPNSPGFRTPFSGQIIAFVVLHTRARTHARTHSVQIQAPDGNDRDDESLSENNNSTLIH
jgi:hypothetical protein